MLGQALKDRLQGLDCNCVIIHHGSASLKIPLVILEQMLIEIITTIILSLKQFHINLQKMCYKPL